jgi:hypothetical protein
MKVISQKQQKQLHQLQHRVERKLNNYSIQILKAGIVVCLFLLPFSRVKSQDWTLDENVNRAYLQTLNLHTESARALLSKDYSIEALYVQSLNEALELLVTEDAERFDDYENRFRERTEKKFKGHIAAYQFLQAEMRLQWAFVYLKFGHELDAAQNLRQAYQIAEECKRKYPRFIPIRKTTGLIEIIIGSVPEKYDWVLSLLGMEGSIETGLEDLNIAKGVESPVAFESRLLSALVQGFVFQKTDAGLREIFTLREQYPQNRLLLFLGAALALKNSQNETALGLLDTLANQQNDGLDLFYADYLRGEAYLHKADYLNSISSYRSFINHYQGQNYMKDAHYKIGLCYWLNGNVNDALAAFKEAKTMGKESSEADKHAARSMSDDNLPNVSLSKVRYFTDGGYYEQAEETLNKISLQDVREKRDQVEYYYRKARLAHKQNQLPAAVLFYQQTIDLAGEENWYFAPNACLQLGYIVLGNGNKEEARTWFNRALGYKKHEYKNSIDSKAKSALAQLRK